MVSGDFTARQAHAAAVHGCQDVIVNYLSSCRNHHIDPRTW
jgi:hypothetical protein